MRACTFFGHRDCPEIIKPALHSVIESLIAEGVTTFYVGNHGQFDTYVRGALGELKKKYPHMDYAVVLAYLPTAGEGSGDTIYPEGMEIGPPRFAIERRNRWMLRQAEVVVSYVRYTWGGAYKFKSAAEKQGKRVIELWSREEKEVQ